MPARGAAWAQARKPGRGRHVARSLRDAGVLGTEKPCDLEPEPPFPPGSHGRTACFLSASANAEDIISRPHASWRPRLAAAPPPHFNLQWARQMPGTESLQSPGRQEPAILPFGSGSRGTERHFVAFLAQGGSDLKPPTAKAGEGPSEQSEQPWECQSEAKEDRQPHSRGDSTQARRQSRGAAALTCYDDFVAVQQELPSLSIPQLDGLCPVPRQLQQRPKAFWLLRDRKRDRVPRGCTRC